MTRASLVTAALVLVAGCASGGAGGSGGSPDVISREQVVALERDVSTAYQLVERLHPEWLRGRGMRGSGEADVPVLYVDDSRAGSLENLRRIPIETVRRVRFVAGTDAGVRYGMGHGGGVILLHTIRR